VDGKRASGGPVTAGSTYLVGERGPELFTPSASGRIIPNGGGGGASVEIIDQRGANAPPVDVQQQMANGRQMIRVLIRDEIGSVFADGSIDRMFAASSMPVRRMGRR
jgi:phage-related minor tail protein